MTHVTGFFSRMSRNKNKTLSRTLNGREKTTLTPTTGAPRAQESTAQVKRLDELLERLTGLEQALARRYEAKDTADAIELRERREELFRADDGYVLAEGLLSEKKHVLGALGLLSFLDAHPDHPDSQDLMRRARDGFRDSGYLDRALRLQERIMEQFPEHRGTDFHILAKLERRMKDLDAALLHIDESVRLAANDDERMKRLYYRAEIVHQKKGERAGLDAYRDVERRAAAVGMGPICHGARKRADRIEERLRRVK